MANSLVLVRARWDDDARVWIAGSEDVPGLVTEADTLELLRDKVMVMIPELLEANSVNSDTSEIAVHILAEQTARIPNPMAVAVAP